ncbi:MAG: hypothetical protein MR671_09530 [Clostridiales bacterium]|uniref:hypothetical protein n=1 Tax=Chordicoccus furentiruminis TaxID=2709410 RepID=UPI0023A8ABDB|nr:hypothetical protein [Chordicoccus furentiruminis]MCI6174480.1 hypothetical protein [Clostridiales bacterium]
MIFEGCQSKAKEISIEERRCPNCGHEVEIFSVDTEVVCENCGFVIYNDKLSCVQWCKYAKQCVGEQRYNQLMKVAQMQKERREAEKKAREEERNAQEAERNARV